MSKSQKVIVHSYKYDSTLYRTHEFPKLIQKKDNFYCVSYKNANVFTFKKNKIFSSKIAYPAIWFFFGDKWYNIIFGFKNKYFCYINIASPMLFEEEAIKFIDFDYDIFIPDVVKNYKKYKLLDSNEFIENSIKYKYSPKLIEKINESVKEVKEMIDSGQITKFFKFKYIDSQKDKKDGKK